jgi:Sulfotransferase family
MGKSGDRRPAAAAGFDRVKYSELIKMGKFKTYKEMYQLVVSSAPQCDDRFDGDFSELRSVVKGIQQEEHLPEFLQMFPDLKFVYILRNPYAQINASLNAQRAGLMSAEDQRLYNNKFEEMDSRAPFPYLGDRIRQLSLSYFFMDKWKEIFPDNFYVLNYDELLTDPEPNLHKLCKFLEVEFDPIMLKTTRGGEDTKGSGWSTGAGGSNHDSSAISTAPLHKWKDQLSPGVIKLTNTLFLDIIEENGFEVVGAKGYQVGEPIHPNEDEETRAANQWLFSVPAGRLI